MFKTLLLCSVLALISNKLCFSRSVGQFCDNDFIDSVLWDGITYSLTRNQWIATYDPKNRTMGQFYHNSEKFKNEKGYYYQSMYFIGKVPECHQKTISCQLINRLKGMTVVAIRRYFPSKDTFDVIRRTYINGNQIDFDFKSFIQSNSVPNHLYQKYSPSVYSQNDCTFIHIINRYQNFGPFLELIELKFNGVTERSFHELTQYKDIVFITSFWWTFDQKTYVIGEHKSGIGKPFIYDLDVKNKNLLLKPISKSVSEFFGCNKPNDNKLKSRIHQKLTDQELDNWSVEILDVKTVTRLDHTIHDKRVESRLQERTFYIPHSAPVWTRIPFGTERSVATQKPVQTTHRTEYKYNFNELTDRKQYRRKDQLRPQMTDRITERIINGDQQPTQVTFKPDTSPRSSQILSNSGPIPFEAEISDGSDYQTVSKSLTDFQKLFPIVIMLSIVLIFILILIFGFISVYNLRNLLTPDINHKKGLKRHGMRNDNGITDFMIEEYDTPQKRLIKCVDTHNDENKTLTCSKLSLD